MSFNSEVKDARSSAKKNSQELNRLKRLVREAKAARERGDPLTAEQEEALRRANELCQDSAEKIGLVLVKGAASAVVGTFGAVWGLATWDSKKFTKTNAWIKKTFW